MLPKDLPTAADPVQPRPADCGLAAHHPEPALPSVRPERCHPWQVGGGRGEGFHLGECHPHQAHKHQGDPSLAHK
jgi:hypothetical protein